MCYGIPFSAFGFQYRCGQGDSNPHSFRNQILSLARLPITPCPLVQHSEYQYSAKVAVQNSRCKDTTFSDIVRKKTEKASKIASPTPPRRQPDRRQNRPKNAAKKRRKKRKKSEKRPKIARLQQADSQQSRSILFFPSSSSLARQQGMVAEGGGAGGEGGSSKRLVISRRKSGLHRIATDFANAKTMNTCALCIFFITGGANNRKFMYFCKKFSTL